MLVICIENESNCYLSKLHQPSNKFTWPINKGDVYNVLRKRHLSPANPKIKTEYLIMDEKKETHWYSSSLFRELTKYESREYKIEKLLIGFH